MSQATTIETVAQIVYPFAELAEAPSWIEPKPEQLVALQGLFRAQDHVDFSEHSAHDYRGPFAEPTHCLRLPMQLALGLHPVGPQTIDTSRLLETFTTYASVESIVAYDGGPKIKMRAQREKAERILTATIVNSALTDHFLNLSVPRDQIEQAIETSQQTGIISKSYARGIRSIVKSVHL